jgi:replication factor A1
MEDAKLSKLIDQILTKRPDLTKQELLSLIDKKKREIGSGYLTDMGALYLIAGELNINLEKEELRLSEIKPSLQNVDIIAFFLTSLPPRTFTDKGGNIRKYLIFYLYDDRIIRGVAWDKAVTLLEELNPKPTDMLLIKKCRVRKGRTEALEIHLSSTSSITILTDRRREGIEKLEKLTKEVSELEEDVGHLIVRGTIASPIRLLSYQNRDGKSAEAISLQLRDSKNLSKQVRVVIWNVKDELIKSLEVGQQIRLVNLMVRKNSFNNIELHGDESTKVEILGYEEPKLGEREFIVVSTGYKKDEERIGVLLLDTDDDSTYVAFLDKELASEFRPGHVLRIPEESLNVKGSSLFISGNIEVIDTNRVDRLENLRSKIENLKTKKGHVIIEALALSKLSISEIKTRSGEIIQKGSLLIGDDTGEARLVAWRELVAMLEDILPGERLIISGAIVRHLPFQEEPIIEVRGYTQIKKLTGSSSL